MSSTDRAARSGTRPTMRAALAAMAATAVAGATLTAVSPAFGDPVTGMTGLVPLPTGATAFLATASEGGSTIAVSFQLDKGDIRERYVKVKSGDTWGPDVLVSDPTLDAFDVSIDVDSDGSVLVAWAEDVPDTSMDQIVVRRVSGGAAGARQVIASNPYSSLDVSGGFSSDVVAWETTGGGPVHAAIDNGAGFGAPGVVTLAAGSIDVADGSLDVTADGGRLHATYLARNANYDFYNFWWATYDSGAWTATDLDWPYWDSTAYYPSIAADADGNALITSSGHDHVADSDLARGYAHVYNASDDIVAPTPQERLYGEFDLSAQTTNGAVNRGGQLLALLGSNPPSYAELTPATNGGAVTEYATADAAECAGQPWVLGLDLGFVCMRHPGTYGSKAEFWTGDGTLLGELTPSAGATQVTGKIIDKAVPVFVVKESRSGDDPQWLLDPSGDGSGPTPTPSTTAPTTAAPTTAPPTTTPPTTTPTAPVATTPVVTPTVTAPAPTPTAPMPTATVSPSSTLQEFVTLTRPRIKGKLVVGERLRARPGTWSPEPGTVRYRWFANGEKIRKATKARLYLKPSLRGKRIKVRIKLVKTGYETEIRYVKRKGRVQAG